MMAISELLDIADTPAGLVVRGLNADSRKIGEGEAFFALPGTGTDGLTYARDAVGRGAVVVVAERDPGGVGVPVVVVPDARAAYARAAMRFYGPQPQYVVG